VAVAEKNETVEILQALKDWDKAEAEQAAKRRRVAKLYRRVFGTPDGTLVLTDLLNELHHNDMRGGDLQTLALQNAAKRILAKIGAFVPENLFHLTEKYLELPMPAAYERREE